MVNEMIERNLGVVRKVVRDMKIANNEDEFEDYYQLGCLGLCECAEKYDANVGAESTYVYRSVKNYLIDAIKNAKSFSFVSLDDNADSSYDDGHHRTYEEVIEDEKASNMITDNLLMNECRTILLEEKHKDVRKNGGMAQGITILLSLLDGKDRDMICKELGLSHQTYDKILYRTRMKLKKNKKLKDLLLDDVV